MIDNNPAQNLETPKLDKRLPKYLSLDDSKKLLTVTVNDESDENKERDYAIITLFLNCGLRLSELIGINLQDINFDDYKLTVIGKGNKERTIYLNKACINAIKAYIKVRPTEGVKNDSKASNKALFLSKRRERISNRTVQYIVEKELRKAGLDTSKVLFTGPGKTMVELEQSVREGLRFINVESVVEAIRIDQIADRVGVEKINVLLRVNIDYFLDGASEYMAGMSTKMGIDQSRFYDDYAVIAKLKHINVCGFHVFAADGVLDYNILLKYTDFVFKFVKEAETVVGQIDVIDFGGGFGIDYTKSGKFFDTKKYFNGLDELVRKYSFTEKEFILELGKFIVGSAGYYATQVVDIKDSKGMKHIVTAGGVNHMRLPIATDRKHPVYIVDMGIPKIYDKQIEVSNETVDIEGPLCMTEDKISWDEYIESAKIGDIVVLAQSGAYCYSASTLWFLSHQIPLELII